LRLYNLTPSREIFTAEKGDIKTEDNGRLTADHNVRLYNLAPSREIFTAEKKGNELPQSAIAY
jgi:exosome complex RNA-binding protein Csl4